MIKTGKIILIKWKTIKRENCFQNQSTLETWKNRGNYKICKMISRVKTSVHRSESFASLTHDSSKITKAEEF